MSWADNIEQVAADHRAASYRLRDQIEATNARAAAKSKELTEAARRAAEEHGRETAECKKAQSAEHEYQCPAADEPEYRQIVRPATEQTDDLDTDEIYRPKSWLI